MRYFNYPGVNTDIQDKDDYKAIEHAMLDKHYMYKQCGLEPCDAYVWGSNSNYTLGTGSQQPKQVPDLLSCFSRTNTNVRQVRKKTNVIQLFIGYKKVSFLFNY